MRGVSAPTRYSFPGQVQCIVGKPFDARRLSRRTLSMRCSGSDTAPTSSDVCALTTAPSPHQLRHLWNYDNSCANKYMGMPLRQCSSTEPTDKPGASRLSEDMMMLLENQIDDMWRGLQSILEIFHDDSKPHLGYRLRVKEQLPLE
ncbi:hypothetical protein L1887_57643 [Cichorium endivia]|nr:hypothetical protein L1887_57643 [Cichorium endivia]